MKNQDQLPEDEIVNMDQFQVGRNHLDEENDDEESLQNEDASSDDSGYTPGESEFADGKGTLLDEQSDEMDDDEENEFDSEELDAPDPDDMDDDAEFENPDDDPA